MFKVDHAIDTVSTVRGHHQASGFVVEKETALFGIVPACLE
jgi:hypothetical protein